MKSAVQARYDVGLIGVVPPKTEKNGQSWDCVLEINKENLGSH